MIGSLYRGSSSNANPAVLKIELLCTYRSMWLKEYFN
jgi:hypothetical protein